MQRKQSYILDTSFKNAVRIIRRLDFEECVEQLNPASFSYICLSNPNYDAPNCALLCSKWNSLTEAGRVWLQALLWISSDSREGGDDEG